MDAFIAEAKHLAATVDEAGRKKLSDVFRELSLSLESPSDAMHRIQHANLPLTVIRIGMDLNLFRLLSESAEPLSVDLIAQKTGAAPVLLSRIMRYLASVRIITETGPGTFTANSISKDLTNPGYEGGIISYHDICTPFFLEMPAFLKDHGYQDVTDALNTPFQRAFNTELKLFDWYQENPHFLQAFSAYMSVNRGNLPTWLDVFPIEKELGGVKPEDPLFVDVGGGMGQQAVALRQRFPDLTGKIINQDMAPVLAHAIQCEGVENMTHDFFHPQTVKGAKAYYLRNIVHDYDDEKMGVILRHLIDAMGPESLLLLDDMVVPTEGVYWQAASVDLIMMGACASMERTKPQWENMLDLAGLKIRDVYTYTPNLKDSLVVAVRKEGGA